jgi:hypothetical protein
MEDSEQQIANARKTASDAWKIAAAADTAVMVANDTANDTADDARAADAVVRALEERYS